jgi:hypothetical protein
VTGLERIVRALAVQSEEAQTERPELRVLADLLHCRGKRLRRWLTTGDTPDPGGPVRIGGEGISDQEETVRLALRTASEQRAMYARVVDDDAVLPAARSLANCLTSIGSSPMHRTRWHISPRTARHEGKC